MNDVAATFTPGSLKRLLCVGAHSDDIEIGAGGSVLTLLERNPDLEVEWVVLSALGEREAEARASADLLLANAAKTSVIVRDFRERYFPYQVDLKEFFDNLGRESSPDLILTPWTGDRHQDHRIVGELTRNTFRDHPILHYEIPKWDGDLGRPNGFVNLTQGIVEQKIAHLFNVFTTQRDRYWFTEETFKAILRIRGIESRAPDGYAEGFHVEKIVLA